MVDIDWLLGWLVGWLATSIDRELESFEFSRDYYYYYLKMDTRMEGR